MNKSKYLIAFVLTVFLTGCPARILFPLFTEKDLVFNPALVGTWVLEEDIYTFSKSGGKSYELMHYTNNAASDTAIFKAELGKLGKFWFLDLFPENRALESHLNNGVYTHHLILAHTISRVWFEGDSIRISTLDDDWLRKMVNKKKLKIPYVHLKDENAGEQLILTASTKELQRLVTKYADNTSAFPNPGVLRRVK
jgi:hypothetical protein